MVCLFRRYAGSEIPSNAGSMWSSALPSLPVGLRTLPDELSSGSDTSRSGDCSTPLAGAFHRTSSSGSFNPLEAYGLLPTSLAEEVGFLLPLRACTSA